MVSYKPDWGRKWRAVKVYNFQVAAVDDKKHQVIPLICKELNFLIIHTAQMMLSFDVMKNIRQSSNA